MRCPFCGDHKSRVIDSRLAREKTEIRRRRACPECGRRFTTRERADEVLLRIVKRDQRREDYDRRKLLAGVQKACEKRPLSPHALERIVDRIERRLEESGEREVTGRRVGELAMAELLSVDAVAASRFASIFHDFQGPEDYATFFASAADANRDETPQALQDAPESKDDRRSPER